MSTLPTPRTDAATDFSSPEKLRDECKKLERELAEAKAERDALKAEIAPLREIVGVRCDAESNPSDITNWLNLVSHADIAKRLKSDLDFSRHETRLQAEIATTLSADLSRWRALAEELAGALDDLIGVAGYAMRQPESEFDCAAELEEPRKALAHFRDAANPASGVAGADQL